MIPLSELEKLRIGCERGNLKQVSATEFLALFAHHSESKKDSERLDNIQASHKVIQTTSTGEEVGISFKTKKCFPNIGKQIDLRSAIDSLKKD